jgi:hypothetical protein
MDRYGRLLCYINRYQPDEEKPEKRPDSYNERLLQKRRVIPYFIWPNINPFRKRTSLIEAVIPAATANDIANEDKSLEAAREWVRKTRQQNAGVFDTHNPLKLLPFEVRFLARRSPPNRWVIDLGKNSDTLISPQEYYTVSNVEDRLFVPEEYVPLFVEKGWQKQH